MISFTFPDVVIAVFVGAFLIRGCVRGFFKETFSVVALGIAILITMQFSDSARSYLSYFMGETGRLDPLVKPLIFLGSWVLAAWFFRVMFGFLSIAAPGWVSRLGGGLIGCGKGVFFIALGLVAFETHASGFLPAGGGDRILPYVRGVSAYIQGFDKAEVEEGLDAAREKLGDKLDSAKEGVGAVKEKLEGLTGGGKEEGGEIETREMRR
ncbi:MAG: CvpA family protein [Nitrospinae bacterium]|nr:CvpA family protein [Nitrospinota bacterium]